MGRSHALIICERITIAVKVCSGIVVQCPPLYFLLQHDKMNKVLIALFQSMTYPFLPESHAAGRINRRPLKAASTLQSLIIPLIRELVRDHPFLKEKTIEWGEVRLTPDLRIATISVSLSEQFAHDLPQILAALKPLTFQLQKKIAPYVTNKCVPRIRFVAHKKGPYDQNIEQLLMSVQRDWKD